MKIYHVEIRDGSRRKGVIIVLANSVADALCMAQDRVDACSEEFGEYELTGEYSYQLINEGIIYVDWVENF